MIPFDRGTVLPVSTVPTQKFTATPEADTIEHMTETIGFDGETFDPAVLIWCQAFTQAGIG